MLRPTTRSLHRTSGLLHRCTSVLRRTTGTLRLTARLQGETVRALRPTTRLLHRTSGWLHRCTSVLRRTRLRGTTRVRRGATRVLRGTTRLLCGTTGVLRRTSLLRSAIRRLLWLTTNRRSLLCQRPTRRLLHRLHWLLARRPRHLLPSTNRPLRCPRTRGRRRRRSRRRRLSEQRIRPTQRISTPTSQRPTQRVRGLKSRRSRRAIERRRGTVAQGIRSGTALRSCRTPAQRISLSARAAITREAFTRDSLGGQMVARGLPTGNAVAGGAVTRRTGAVAQRTGKRRTVAQGICSATALRSCRTPAQRISLSARAAIIREAFTRDSLGGQMVARGLPTGNAVAGGAVTRRTGAVAQRTGKRRTVAQGIRSWTALRGCRASAQRIPLPVHAAIAREAFTRGALARRTVVRRLLAGNAVAGEAVARRTGSVAQRTGNRRAVAGDALAGEVVARRTGSVARWALGRQTIAQGRLIAGVLGGEPITRRALRRGALIRRTRTLLLAQGVGR